MKYTDPVCCLRALSLLGLALLGSGATAQVVLDFESYFDTGTNTVEALNRGDEVTTQYGSVGVTFSAQKYKSNGDLKDAELWIFDTNLPTFGSAAGNDGDPDLVTPGYGPGNNLDLGNVLVIQENTNRPKIPDDNSRGGVITVTFSTPVFIHSTEFLDLESSEQLDIIGLDSGMNEIFDIGTFANLGDNSYNKVLFNDSVAVKYLVFDLHGSGALGSLVFTPVPEPATVAFMSVGGLGLLLLVRRRILSGRKAAKTA